MTRTSLPISRRRLLALGGAAAVSSTLPALKVTYAAAPKERPLVLVLLRGGPDGQAILPLHGDPAYAKRRGSLALPLPDAPGGLFDLDGTIGLHPAAGSLLPLWADGKMVVLPAVASPYRGDRHAEAISVLDSGLPAFDPAAASGWLNRAIAATGAAESNGRADGGATARTTPLVLRGTSPTSMVTGADEPPEGDRLFAKVGALYKHDPVLSETLKAGLTARNALATALGNDHTDANALGRQPQSFPFLATTVGHALVDPSGPGAAVIELGGWDTHIQQGADRGPLARRIAGLSEGLVALVEALGSKFDDSAIVVIGEFGRSVTPNAAGGTDHGLGGPAMMIGGGIQGSKRLGPIPGLDEEFSLHGSALTPTVDSRALFKAVLKRHWGISRSALDKRVFPDSGATAPIEGL